MLKELRHVNVIELKDVIHGKNQLYLIFEFFYGNMDSYLHRGRAPLTPPHVKHLMKQLLLGLLHCHERRIIHRDLQPMHLLIDQTGQNLKIADFGKARTFSLPLKTYTYGVVTLRYRAPEMLLGQSIYSTAIDMWSVGTIFYEMAHKRRLFDGDHSEIGQIFKIFKILGTPTEETW